VSGLVAVVSHDRRSAVPADEMTALVRRFTALRGDGEVRHAGAGAWARVVHIGSGAAGAWEEGENWAAAAGALHTPAPLTTVPLADLEGQFAGVRHRASADVVEAFSDPFGMQQFYCAEHAGRTYLSTSATVLAGHLDAPADERGAEHFLRTGKQMGPVTLWQGVERLDPATVLRFGRDGRSRAVYWRPVVDSAVRALSLQRTIDHVAEVASATVGRWLGGHSHMWADLTGGYDSRLAVALLARAGLPFRANTSGEAETADVRLAREVARAGGFDWRHERLPVGWRLDPAFLDEAVGWSDGTLDVLALGEIQWRQDRRRRFAPVVVNGGGGEHLGPMPWLQEFNQAGRSSEVNFENFLRMRMLPPAAGPSVLRADRVDAVEAYCRDYAREVFARRTEPYRDELNTTQLDMMYVYRAISHFGAFRSAFEAHVRTEIPFYFKDVFSAGLSSDHRWRNGHRLHRGVIERVGPRISAVATERGGPAQRVRAGNAHRFLPYYGRLGRTAVRKLRGRPAPTTPMPSSQADAYAAAVRALQADGVFDVDSMRTGPLYDRVALERMVEQVGSRGFSAWTVLGRVTTLELALRRTDTAL
jgi:hypothetical protein